MGFDPHRTLEILQQHAVRFVIIGGVAGRMWGSPTVTSDLDICYSRDPPNLHLLADALTELHGRLRGVDDDVPFRLDPITLGNGLNFTFITDTGPLDVLGMPAGTKGFDELATNAELFDFGAGVTALVCDLDDLIRMKRAAGRPKDRIELEILAAVREERSKPGGP